MNFKLYDRMDIISYQNPKDDKDLVKIIEKWQIKKSNPEIFITFNENIIIFEFFSGYNESFYIQISHSEMPFCFFKMVVCGIAKTSLFEVTFLLHLYPSFSNVCMKNIHTRKRFCLYHPILSTINTTDYENFTLSIRKYAKIFKLISILA